MNHILLMMGGTGTRFGADRPKQYTLIHDRPLFSYILKRLDRYDKVDSIVIVTHADWFEYAEEWSAKALKHVKFHVVCGGENRSQSVRNGLNKLKEYAGDQDVVMIHDATHPYVDEKGMDGIIEAVKEFGGATLAARNYDTVYRIDENGFLANVEPRQFIVAGASPEAFRFGDIYAIYHDSSDEELSTMTSAGAIALAHSIPMKAIDAGVLNLKITYHNDMELFLALADNYFFPDDMEKEKN